MKGMKSIVTFKVESKAAADNILNPCPNPKKLMLVISYELSV